MIYKPVPISISLIYIISTLFDKSFNSDFFFDILFSIDSKSFFNCLFYWQPMTISTSLSLDLIASHCHISWENILDTSSKQMSIMRCSTSKRRTIKKTILKSRAFLFDRPIKSIILFPKSKD